MPQPSYQLHHLCIFERQPRDAMWKWLRWYHAIPAYYWEGLPDLHHTGEGGVDYTFLACGGPFQMQMEAPPYQFEYERNWFEQHDSAINHICWIVPSADGLVPPRALRSWRWRPPDPGDSRQARRGRPGPRCDANGLITAGPHWATAPGNLRGPAGSRSPTGDLSLRHAEACGASPAWAERTPRRRRLPAPGRSVRQAQSSDRRRRPRGP